MSGVYLKQSTASQSRAIGPFVDDTDFKTVETGLTIANTDIKLVVNGGAAADKNSGGGTHRANGVYGVTFDATDTATVGEMQVSVVVSGALPVFKTFFVLEEAVYDNLFGASAIGPMPIYTQPTGFLTATFPTTVASTTNITAGTITTVTNLTNLPAITTDWLTSTGLADSAAQEIADAILSRNASNVEGTAGEHTLCTVILAMLEHSISGSTLTIKRTDGTTTHATKTLTTNASADPITGID